MLTAGEGEFAGLFQSSARITALLLVLTVQILCEAGL